MFKKTRASFHAAVNAILALREAVDRLTTLAESINESTAYTASHIRDDRHVSGKRAL